MRVGAWMTAAVLAGLVAAACGDDPFGVEDALGVWEAREVNGQALPGNVWVYDGPDDSIEIPLAALEVVFLASSSCTFGAMAEGFTPDVMDDCTYAVGPEGEIDMTVEGLDLSGTSSGDDLTLTAEDGNVYLLRRRSTATASVAAVGLTPPADTARAGAEIRLTAVPQDAAGHPLIRRVTWASDDQDVAMVHGGGYVTGQSAGVATITARSEGHEAAAEVTVWVGVTGTWAGTIASPSGTCPWTLSITESAAAAIAGTGQLFAPCAAMALTITGSNNTGGVADSVVMVFSYPGGAIRFDGSFDGQSVLTGGVTGPGAGQGPYATTYTRQSFAAAPLVQAWARPGSPSRTAAYPLRD